MPKSRVAYTGLYAYWNLVYGFWSLWNSNSIDSWQWGATQSSILLGQERVH